MIGEGSKKRILQEGILRKEKEKQRKSEMN